MYNHSFLKMISFIIGGKTLSLFLIFYTLYTVESFRKKQTNKDFWFRYLLFSPLRNGGWKCKESSTERNVNNPFREGNPTQK